MATGDSATLTVIMCNYNHGHLISRAIDAVVAQSRRPDELIIIDDASTDQSIEIIRRHIAPHPWIRLVQNERNLGVNGAVNRGLECAWGTYVYLGAADDVVLPGFFERAMEMALKYPDAGSIVGSCIMAELNGRELGLLTAPAWEDRSYIGPRAFLENYLFKVAPTHSFVAAVVFKTATLREIGGFRADLGFWADTFAFRTIGLRHGVCFIAQPCARWHVLPGSVCHGTTKHPRKELEVLESLLGVMTSSEFRAHYPEKFVRQWRAKYREEIITKAVARLDESFGLASAVLWPNLLPRSRFGRLVKAALVRLDGLHRWVLRKALRHSLGRYKKQSFA